jgi:hypothetical protein
MASESRAWFAVFVLPVATALVAAASHPGRRSTLPRDSRTGDPTGKADPTAPPTHQQQDNTLKYATMENGVETMVLQFVKQGEIVRVEVATGKYVDRVRTDPKKL